VRRKAFVLASQNERTIEERRVEQTFDFLCRDHASSTYRVPRHELRDPCKVAARCSTTPRCAAKRIVASGSGTTRIPCRTQLPFALRQDWCGPRRQVPFDTFPARAAFRGRAHGHRVARFATVACPALAANGTGALLTHALVPSRRTLVWREVSVVDEPEITKIRAHHRRPSDGSASENGRDSLLLRVAPCRSCNASPSS